MSLCKACVTGVTHEGDPAGKIEEINGVKTYVSLPPAGTDYDKTKAVLLLTDVFGIQLINSRLLADDFAKNGLQTYAPDYLNDDPIKSLDGLADIGSWFPNHVAEQTRPPLDKVIAGLKERGVKEFAATGYCFGARYVFDLAFDNVIKVAAVSHPSLLKVPEDLEKFKATGIPLLINSCESDGMYPIPSQQTGDQIFAGKVLEGDKLITDNYERYYFEGCEHGFAVRGDLSKPLVKKGKEESFLHTAEWFLKKL